MPKVNVYHQFDPESDAAGGIARYVLSLIKNSVGQIDFCLICSTTEPEKVGRFANIIIGNHTVQCLPVSLISRNGVRGFFPVTLKYVIGLWRFKKYIPFSDVDFVQRIEYIDVIKRRNAKKVFIVHNDIPKQILGSFRESKWSYVKRAFSAYFSKRLSYFDLVLSVNSNSIDFLKSEYGRDAHFSPTWPNSSIFFDMELSKNTRLSVLGNYLNVCEQDVVILFVGRFQEQKNVPLFLNTLKELPVNYKGILVGDGDLKEEMIALANDLGVSDRACFIGSQNPNTIALLMNSVSVYVSTSFYEGMSLALLEALKCGTPVVTTRTGESKRIISDLNGALVGTIPSEIADSIMSVQQKKINRRLVSHSVIDFDSKCIIEQLIQIAKN